MVDKEEIKQQFNLFFDISGKMTVADDGKVNVTGTVELRGTYSHFPVQFDTVGGNFECYHAGLHSLQGSPSKVGGRFYCSDNQLLSLEGGPDWVGGDFWCESNPLESLKGAPSYIGEEFYLSYDPNLPLLRTLVAKKGVYFQNKRKYPFAEKIKNVLNQFAGQGKAGVLKCSHALLTLEKELGIDIRANIRW
jgi:hypothetical protein